MPPAISDDEESDIGELSVPLRSTRERKPMSSLKDGDDMAKAVRSGSKNGDNDHEEDNDIEEEDEEEDPMDLEEDEYIVEKILAHTVEPNDLILFKVKWEGYDKKSDQTWESYDNLKENAVDILEEYLASVGGKEKIIADTKGAMKTKKRGRPPTGTPSNGKKRPRNEDHPASATPPAGTKSWKPPVGSWEDEVESIDACHDEASGKLIVYLTWKNGNKTQHETKVIYQRCPQKMLQFYERHVKIVMSSTDNSNNLP